MNTWDTGREQGHHDAPGQNGTLSNGLLEKTENDVLQVYEELKFKMIRVGTDKRPMTKNWPENPGMSAAEAHQALRDGSWIGIVVPDGMYAQDVDDPETVRFLEEKLEELIEMGVVINKTPHGYHLIFKGRPDGRHDQPGVRGSPSVLPNGCKVTPRLAGRFMLIVAPTPGRYWMTDPRGMADAPVLPDEWTPVMSAEAWQKAHSEAADPGGDDQVGSVTQRSPQIDGEVTVTRRQMQEFRWVQHFEEFVDSACEAIRMAPVGSRNSTINKLVFTVAGMVGGAGVTGIQVDGPAVLSRLVEAVRMSQDQEPDRAEMDARLSWNTGLARPLSPTLGEVVKAVKTVKREIVIATRRDAVPVPDETYTMAETVRMSVDRIFDEFEVVRYNRQLLYRPTASTGPFTPLATQDDHNAVRELSPFFKMHLTFIELKDGVEVPWVPNIEGKLTKELLARIPTLRYLGGPMWIDGQLHFEDSADIRIVEVAVVPADCTVQASAAWLLDDLFGDYTFASEQDRNRALMMMTLPFLRSGIGGCVPLILYIGTEKGVGKTTLARLLPQMHVDDYVDLLFETSKIKDETELEKQLTSLLKLGLRFLLLDNIRGILESETLEAFITGMSFIKRLLGGNDLLRASTENMVVMGTLNGLELGADMSRRAMPICMSPKLGLTQASQLRHPDLVAWTKENLPVIRGHVLNIVQGWVDAGAPRDQSQLAGSFGNFCAVIGGIGQWLGLPVGQLVDKDDNQERFGTDRAQHEAFLALFLHQHFAGRSFSPREALQAVREQQRTAEGLRSYPVLDALDMALLIDDYDRYAGPSSRSLDTRMGTLLSREIGQKILRIDGLLLRIVRAHRTSYGQPYVVEKIHPTATHFDDPI